MKFNFFPSTKLRLFLIFLLTLPLLTQAQTWTGFASNDWDETTNWNPASVPLAGNDVIIPNVGFSPVIKGLPASPAVCNNLTIVPGAVITIIAGKALTVNGDLSNGTTKCIVIESDVNGTGSLIIKGNSTGSTVTAQRYMNAGAWHMVSSPLSGQTVANFLGSNIQIAKIGTNRGMMDYNPVANTWNAFFINGNPYGNIGAGKGFSMRTTNSSAVSFTGLLQTGNQSITGLSVGNWNCIGNPYTSAIGINTASSSTDKFIDVNAANLDPSYGAIYVWDQPDGSNNTWGKYTVISNISPNNAAFVVQQGQAFFVKMNSSATSVNFTPAMQIHQPDLALKSTGKVWPMIKLETTMESQKSSTVIAFNSSMTKGLDPTYDAGLLKGESDLIVYSKLVEDNGIPFAIQALPDFKTMIIPIGLDYKTGGDVVFSAELLNLPVDCKVILEDKHTKTFTDLSTETYKVAVTANSVIVDRFQLHTSELTSKLENNTLTRQLKAYAISNLEIRVIGEVSNHCIARLYNVQGNVVLIQNLKAGKLNVIPTQAIKNGLYMLSVEDQGKAQTFKLLIRE